MAYNKCKISNNYNILNDLEYRSIELEKEEKIEFTELNEKIKKYFKMGIEYLICIFIKIIL